MILAVSLHSAARTLLLCPPSGELQLFTALPEFTQQKKNAFPLNISLLGVLEVVSCLLTSMLSCLSPFVDYRRLK